MHKASKNLLLLLVFCFSLLSFPAFSEPSGSRFIPSKQTCHKLLVTTLLLSMSFITPASLYLHFGIQDGKLDQAKIQKSEEYQQINFNLLTLSTEHQREVALALAAQIRASSLMPAGAASEKKLTFYNSSNALYELLREPLSEELEADLTARGFGRHLLKLSSEAELRKQLGVAEDYLKEIPDRLVMNHALQPFEPIAPGLVNKLPTFYLPIRINVPLSWDFFKYERGISPTDATTRELVDERVAAWILTRLEILEKRGEKRITPTMIIDTLSWHRYFRANALHIDEMNGNDKYLRYGTAGFWILFNAPKSVFESGAITHFIQKRKLLTSFYENESFDIDAELNSQIKIDLKDKNFWFSSFTDKKDYEARMSLILLLSQFTVENAELYGISYIEAMKGILEELKSYPSKESR